MSEWHLVTLPVDIFRHISDYLGCWTLYMLWCTSKVVQHRLEERPMVKRVHISQPHLRRLPSFWIRFHGLTSLNVYSNMNRILGIMPKDVRQWPKTLEELRIECWEANAVFYDHFEPSVKWVERLLKLQRDDGRYQDSERAMNIGELFPRLRVFETNGAVPHAATFLIPSMPPSVTSIALRGYHGKDFPTYNGPLPPNLISLQIAGKGRGPFALAPSLSPDFMKLDMFVSVVDPLPYNLAHLEHLEMDALAGTDFAPLSACVNLKYFRVYPSSVVSAQAVIPAIMHMRQLETLFISECNLSDSDIPLLPRTLRYVHFKGTNLSESSFKHLPRGLRHIMISPPQGLRVDENFRDFPPLFEYAHIFRWPMHDEDMRYYPPTATSHISANYSPACLEYAPKSLTTLTLYQNSPQQRRLEGTDIPLLPPKLTKLWYYGRTSLQDEDVKSLPKTLRSLYLSLDNPMSSSSWKYLPTGLEILNMPEATDVTIESIADLPRSLKELQVRAYAYLPGTCIPLLPRSLERLVIKGVEDWVDDDLAQLPPHLTELTVPRLKNLTNRAIKLLPDSLVYLNVRNNRNFTAELIPHIPSNLLALRIRKNRNFKNHHRAQLPKDLELQAKGYKHMPSYYW